MPKRGWYKYPCYYCGKLIKCNTKDLNKRKIIGMHHRNVKKNYSSKTPIIVMAGGKGKRLMPLTKNSPKAMLKIKGKPMMESILLKARFFGYRKFIL